MDNVTQRHRQLMDTPRLYDLGDGDRERRFRADFTARMRRDDADAVLEWVAGEPRSREFVDTALHFQGIALKYGERYEEARRSLNDALALRRGRGNPAMIAATLVVLAQLSADEGDFPVAWLLLDEAMALAPQFPSVHLNRIATADVQGDRGRVQRAFEDMTMRYPQWAHDHYLVAKLHTPTWLNLHELPVFAEIVKAHRGLQ